MAPDFVNSQIALENDLLAILQELPVRRRLAAKQNAAQLGIGIFEREVNVAGTLNAQVGDFARNPDLPHFLLQEAAHRGRKLSHRQDTTSGFGRKKLSEVPLRLCVFAHVCFGGPVRRRLRCTQLPGRGSDMR